MTNQELIQEAAVIRDERNQYANTAERVGTALVHMAEQLAAQAADMDKVEADVRGALTLSQLDNPFGFTTVAQWMQGLRGEQSYTFRLVEPTTGRCIGHVWLFNDADNPSNSNLAARTLEVVMCCATINADTGRLTYDAINGSPRIYYRSYCAPLTGGTPDGGSPVGNKWSLWQEYRDYVAKPIKDALAALQQQHSTDVAALQAKHDTDVADLQASINATLAAIPTGVLNLGMSADADTILAEAAKYAVASDPFKAVITGQYMVGTAVQSIVIHQQVTKSSDGSGVCMQYVYKDKARYTRYINFNAAAKVTAVQGVQLDGVRSITTENDNTGTRLVLKDMNGGTISTSEALPEATEDTDGIMTAEQAKNVSSVTKLGEFSTMHAALVQARLFKFAGETNTSLLTASTKESGRYQDLTILQQTTQYEDHYRTIQYYLKVGNLFTRYIEYNLDGSTRSVSSESVMGFRSLQIDANGTLKAMGNWGNPVASVKIPQNDNLREGTPTLTTVPLILTKSITGTAECVLNAATTARAGLMTASHVEKLANLESRIAALEAKSK